MDLLKEIEKKAIRKTELETELSDPGILSDQKKMREVNEEFSRINKILEIGESYRIAAANLKNAKETLKETNDQEMRDLAEEEISDIEKKLPTLEQNLTVALIPPDPLDKKNTIVEIRAGAGGDEAGIFASDLLRLYTRYAERNGWKTELISSNSNEAGGFKEVIIQISGTDVYSHLKFESGVHRVQRVPSTEKQGRVHTSTATVAVLPEAEEVDVNIAPKDLHIEATTSTGAGGQSVNTTYSAIRITHLPTGIMVYCQDERSQKQNKERALQIIRARVFAAEAEKARQEREEARRDQIGRGDRSEKIRTYNYAQDRVTDHRIKQNFHNLPGIMDGDIEEIVTALKLAELEERIQS